ncbi:MAG: HU family DNA-binding protein [Oscillospiraceae bacterium]|nr:HU family DNA-binding protein [Oscillospiraceae bacterium]
MNKNDLLTAMVEKSGLSKKAAGAALDAFTASVVDALKAGDKVTLVGFGIFEVRARAARKGINPQTKKTIKIKASKAPAFKAGKALKDALN